MDGSEVVWNFEDTGTTTTSSKGKAELRWTAYSKYKETSELFVLFFESGNCAFIPKRSYGISLNCGGVAGAYSKG
jgi:hypothetical protein